MRIGAVLSPIDSWEWILDAALAADELGFDAVGLWDHYHSARPELGYVAGWSAHAALAQATKRVRITPAVINTLHFELGVLAKESSVLSLISGDRLELALGAGDWPSSFEAWGQPFPDRLERVALLSETVDVLRRLWTGELVTFDGRFHHLHDAGCTPAPRAAPRVVVGVGTSATLAESAVNFADELNVYADEEILRRGQRLVERSGRQVDVSMFFSWEWDKWPADPIAELTRWGEQGVDRALVSLGSDDMPDRLRRLAPLLG